MDKEIIFYIIFGLIYLLSRASKKWKKKIPKAPPLQSPLNQGSPVPREPATPDNTTVVEVEEERPGPLSFEDILREISGQSKKKPAPEPEPEVEVKPELKIEEVPEPEPVSDEPVNEMDIRSADAADLWNAYKTKEVKTDSDFLVSKDSTQVIPKESERFGSYAIQDDTNYLAKEIREMLEDKENVKKAIVLSEILQRRF